jgi:hypothetical protein
MTIKKCTCGHQISTKKAKILGITKFAGKRVMWVNCPACESTATLIAPLKKVLTVVVAVVVASCAPKAASRFTVCEPVQVICKTGQCLQAFSDINSGQLVNPNQCDEVQSGN